MSIKVIYSRMAKEFEIKFSPIDKPALRKALAENGFVLIRDEFLMLRKTFHPVTTDKNEFFRIRKESGKTTMTYKHIGSLSVDGVEEIETEVSDFDAASEILMKAGLKNTSTQENLREIWNNGEAEVCIDTWPGLSPYVEIE